MSLSRADVSSLFPHAHNLSATAPTTMSFLKASRKKEKGERHPQQMHLIG